GKLDISVEVTEDALIAAGLTSHKRDGIRILNKGTLTSAVKLSVTGASAAAVEAVAAAGGTLTTAPVLEPHGKSVRKTAQA
ncbi:MAG: uL15 family ribosomal protein, partial [Paracoccaceae bacterium]